MTRETAIRTGKAQTMNQCVFTGAEGTDGAHCFSAGDFPELADLPENIFAMNRRHHSLRGKACFDFCQVDGVDRVRPVSERLWMLENMVLDDLRPLVWKKLRKLRQWCEIRQVDWPEPEKPADIAPLLYAERLA